MLDLKNILSSMDATENKDVVFRPVRCFEKQLTGKTAVDGFVYFTTDSKKIYCGVGGKFIPMGGNSGIYYGTRTFTEDETGTDQTDFIFFRDHIDGGELPQLNDLILNSDGCFYRVVNASENQCIGRRLTVAGGSGGPVGPGGSGSVPSLSDEYNGATVYFNINKPDTMKLYFTATSLVPENNSIRKLRILIGTNEIIEDNLNYKFNTKIELDLNKYLKYLNTSGPNTISVEATDAFNGTSQKLFFNVTIVNLALETKSPPILKVDLTTGEEGNYANYFAQPKGGSGLKNRNLIIKVTPINDLNNIVYSDTIKVNNTDEIPININMKDLTNPVHGVYYLSVGYEAYVDNPNGSVDIIDAEKLEAQIIYFDKSVNSTLIATNFIGGTVTQYDSYTMKYMVATDSDLTEDYVTIYVGEVTDVQKPTLNQINNWDYTFINTGVFEIAIQYDSSRQVLGTMSVVEYEGDIPTINTTTDNTLELYLTALGKSNSQAAKEEWTWINPRTKEKYETTFNKFLWGDENGWKKEGDEAFLRLTNGASIELTNYHPFATDATMDGMTIEIDFRLSGVLDYSKPLISCLSSTTDADGKPLIYSGFQITGQRATLNSSVIKASSTDIEGGEDENGNVSEQDAALQAFTQYLNEDTRIHLTYVIPRIYDGFTKDDYFFVYTYLDGVMSGMAKLSANAANNTHESFADGYGIPSTIKIDSTWGDIDIFNIRIYRTALSPRNVIKNYIADISNIDDRIAANKDNNILHDNGSIDLKLIQDLSYRLNIPYVLFKGGNPIEKKPTNPFTYTKADYMLPQRKDDYRLMSVAMYDSKVDQKTPIWNVPIELEDANSGEKVNSFDGMQTGATYKAKRGVQVYGQGTSSMIYPVKNLRLKTIKSDDFPSVKGSVPLEIVCFKTDYMDSSASHNTSTGNLVFNLLTQLNLKTPPQKFAEENKGKEGATSHEIVTAIKGYPIICFYQPGDEDEEWTFIGRYNFNIDKATPEPFGFIPQKVYVETEDKDEEGKPIIKTVIDEEGRERKVVKVCGLKTEKIDGETVLPLDAEGKEIERDIVQCWEILNNDNGTLTKFLTDGFPNFDQAFYSLTAKGAQNWTGYYEDRYPDELKGIGEKGAEDISEWPTYYDDLNSGIYRVAEWLNSTATGEITSKPLDEPKYYRTLDKVWDSSKNYYNFDGTPYEVQLLINTRIEQTGFMNEDEYLKQVILDGDKFELKAASEDLDFGVYSFLYSEDHWSLLKDGQIVFENVDPNDYGVTYGPAIPPKTGHTLNVTYEQYNTWNATLYELYTHDTAPYRLSKFKSEFTQYFNMEFSLFYYILTLVLLMMDSRAKNMMLASWDHTIWYPIFYDMDTMLGINNTGFNKFSYDIEDDPADKVFNGWDSVLWNNFRECFGTEIYTFYGRMRDAGLDLSTLLDTYNDNAANAWNEALMTADAVYKYERPFREGYYNGKDKVNVAPGAKNYLYASQGRRSNHRAWWLGNRLPYFDSKYIPNTYGDIKPDPDTNFTFRAYAIPEQRNSARAEECIAMVPPNHNFTLTALTNGYLSTFVGNTVFGPVYTIAGKTATLGPGNQTRHEVESYILSPELISDLGDLSDKYLGQFTFPATKKLRLTSLKFGRSQRSHGAYIDKNGNQVPEKYSKYYNKLLTSLDVGQSCPYLMDVNIARCVALSSVDLSYCSRLQTLDAEGCTGLSDIIFPANSILEKVYLPDALTSLTLTNQPHLEVLELESVRRLESIALDRVTKLNSYPLVKKVFSTAPAKGFYLTEVNWVITDDQVNVTTKDNGKTYITGIDILEILKDTTRAYPLRNLTVAQALTGTITIDIENANINEYEIYNKYKSIYPNLTIQYSDRVALEQAIDLRFMSGDGTTVHYQVYGETGNKVGTLISVNGPNGKPLTDPNKPDTEAYTYEFTGLWQDETSPNTIYWDNQKFSSYSDAYSVMQSLFPDDYSKSLTNLRTMNLNNPDKYDYIFKPLFYEKDRMYTVLFYDGNQKVGEVQVKYNTKYDIENATIKNYYYKDSSSLLLEERWAFQGWSMTNYGTDANVVNPSYVDLNDFTVKSPTTLYSHYQIENCRKVPSKSDYFVRSGSTISIKEEYRETLQGKITIPSTLENVVLDTLGNFSYMVNVTHIFFEESNLTFTNITGSAFTHNDALVYVELPASITKIGSSAFSYCGSLEQCDLPERLKEIGTSAFANNPKLAISRLPSQLEIIDMGAFQNDSKIAITEIPKSVQIIGYNAFNRCSNIGITKFGGSDCALVEIAEGAFVNAGNNINIVQIGSSVEIIGPNAFQNYGINNGSLTVLTFAKEPTLYYTSTDRNMTHESPTTMGFKEGIFGEKSVGI